MSKDIQGRDVGTITGGSKLNKNRRGIVNMGKRNGEKKATCLNGKKIRSLIQLSESRMITDVLSISHTDTRAISRAPSHVHGRAKERTFLKRLHHKNSIIAKMEKKSKNPSIEIAIITAAFTRLTAFTTNITPSSTQSTHECAEARGGHKGCCAGEILETCLH